MANRRFLWFSGTVVALYFVTILFFYTLPFGTTIFQDVPSGYWAAYEIEEMYNRGLMKGRDESVWNFYPGEPMTRAELVALMLKVNEIEVDKLEKPAQGQYADVPNTHWASGVFSEASKRNLIPFKDADKGLIVPDKKITRGELAQAVVQSLGLPYDASKSGELPDVKGNPYEEAIRTLVSNNYAKGDAQGNFRPNDEARRDEVASLFARALRDVRPLKGGEKK
jgi:hypothetical protein